MFQRHHLDYYNIGIIFCEAEQQTLQDSSYSYDGVWEFSTIYYPMFQTIIIMGV